VVALWVVVLLPGTIMAAALGLDHLETHALHPPAHRASRHVSLHARARWITAWIVRTWSRLPHPSA
jgi:hypothetical protein